MLKSLFLFQGSKRGYLNIPEDPGINPAGEEWQERGGSAGEGEAGAEERDHGSGRDNVLIRKGLCPPPAFEKTSGAGWQWWPSEHRQLRQAFLS